MECFDCLFLTSTHDVKDDIDIEIGGLDELGSLFGFVHDLLQWLGEMLFVLLFNAGTAAY